MRFGLVHRVMTDVLATLGLLSLVTSGGLNRWVVIALVSALTLSMFIPERYQFHQRLRSFGVVTSLGLLAMQTMRLAWGHDVLTIAVEFAAGLQIIRLATRRGAAHDQQIILLALLHLVAGTVIGGGLAYGLCFLGFLVVAPGALVLSHLRREVEGNYRQGARDRTGLPVDVPRILRSRRVISKRFLLYTCSLSIPIFVFTAVLFVLFPRVGLSLLLLNHSRSERMIGFSDRVDLGKVGRLRSDSTIALRVHLPNLPEDAPARIPLYLRGTAFDSYNGNSWSRDRTQTQSVRSANRIWTTSTRTPLGPELMTVDLQPIKPPVVFLPQGAHGFDVLSKEDRLLGNAPRITRGRESDFEYVSFEDRGLRYRVYGAGPQTPIEELPPQALARYLALPPQLPERVGELARSWAGALSSPLKIARHIESKLRTDYEYDLNSPSGAADNPLDHFLFESKRGHCEFYSTGMAIMLRTLGIPTRNVTGFIGGTLNRFGRFYAVRQGDAHSWVEVYLPNRGWWRFDPTPASESAPRAEIDGMVAFLRDLMEAAGERWNRHIVGYDLDQQIGIFRSVRRWPGASQSKQWIQSNRRPLMIMLVIGAAGAGCYYYWRRKKREEEDRPSAPTEQQRSVRQAVALYQQLEDVMRAQRIPRLAATPPLAHARGLADLGHPLGAELLELTWIYQRARFGNEPFSEADAQQFADRVKTLGERELVETEAA